MLIYLSHPIDRANRSVITTTNKTLLQIYNTFQNSEHHFFKPGNAFHLGNKATPDHTIEQINQKAQEIAGAIIVIWPEKAKSWGVPVEVERAINNNQPVIFLTNALQTWAMPTAWSTSPNIYHTGLDRDSIEQAKEWLTMTTTTPTPTTKPLPYQKLTENAQTPTRAYNDDAGFDLYVSQTTTIKPGQFTDIPCAIAVELPTDSWAMLTGRSSTLRKHGLMVNQGIIDTGYRGELYAGVFNLSGHDVTINKGDRVAQLILMPNHTANYTPTEMVELNQHPRGQKGFGSSGR